MWPVMTLTLLLQLTDDEQLYAEVPVLKEPVQEQAPAPANTNEATTAPWPEETEVNG